jgi:transposase
MLKLVEVQGNDKPLRGLLWCSSTIEGNSKQGSFVDRDVNATMNILRCAIEDQRPEILDRSKQRTRLPKQVVGKTIINSKPKPKGELRP